MKPEYAELALKFFLYQTPAILAASYLALEHFGAIDSITRRNRAVDGLRRLQSAAGFPVSWIYNDEQDRPIFEALYIRIKKNTQQMKLRGVLSEGHTPSAIVTAGQPLAIGGLPPEWLQGEKLFYSQSHPILFLFGVTRQGQEKGKAAKACTIKELEDWLKDEKDSRKFWFGVLVAAALSCVFFFAREFPN